MGFTHPSEFEEHKAVIRTNADTIVVRDYGNCSVMHRIFESALRVGNISTTDDGHLKVNVVRK